MILHHSGIVYLIILFHKYSKNCTEEPSTHLIEAFNIHYQLTNYKHAARVKIGKYGETGVNIGQQVSA